MSSTGVGPTKQEIEAVFSRLRAQPANKSCFDCSAKAPTWSSVTYGVFICIDCSAVHRSLGVHLTFVRSTNLDTNWTWLQLRQMQLGGNANAAQFFRQHNCITTDAQQKYNSRAAMLYRDKLTAMAQQAMKVHGTKLHLENSNDKSEGNEAVKAAGDGDFFAECENDNNKASLFENNNIETVDTSSKIELTPMITPPIGGEKLTPSSMGAPSVDLLNSGAPVSASLTPSIGVRKIQPKKSGLGARRGGGLGATKVKTNFAEIEQRANLANQCKAASSVPEKPMTAEEELESVASMRLAYQDLSLQKTREEAKLKTVDPLKAKQMERLGMGFSLRGSDVSHSALGDMETIEQPSAPKAAPQSKNWAADNTDIDDFFLYPEPMYGGEGGSGSGNSANLKSIISKIDKEELEILGFQPVDSHSIEAYHSKVTAMFAERDRDTKTQNNKSSSTSSGYETSARKSNAHDKNKDDNQDNMAQKKFGSAKGFGSDQFFGNEQSSADVSANLSRFQGSNSISSADYFGDGTSQSNRTSRGYSTGVNFQAPDLDDVKESVRQGVHKVAGRLSSLATDVMTSLQDKYGY